MTTTPADLLAAAEYFTSRQSCECDHEVGITNCIGCDIDRMARHILATVHTDDDEPVTVAWLLSIGGEDRRNNSVPSIQFSGDSNVVLRYYPKLDVWHVSGSTWKPKNRGQLRHLLAGLGMGGGK